MSSRKNDAEQKPLMYIVQPDYDILIPPICSWYIYMQKRRNQKKRKSNPLTDCFLALCYRAMI